MAARRAGSPSTRSTAVATARGEREDTSRPAPPRVPGTAAAVPGTLGGAGLLVSSRSPLAVATAVERVLGDPALRAAMVKRGHARARQFALDRSRARFADAMAAVVP